MFVVHVWQTWQEALEWNYGAFIIETLCLPWCLIGNWLLIMVSKTGECMVRTIF